MSIDQNLPIATARRIIQTNSSSTSYAQVAKQNTSQSNDGRTQYENLAPQQSNQQQQQKQQQQQQGNQQQNSQQKRTRPDNTTQPQQAVTDVSKQKQKLDTESPPRKRNPILAQTSPPAPSSREGASDVECTDPNSIPPGGTRSTRSRSRIEIKK
ncbi:probable basic-leucine zipper transcription factor R [Uranotaenia lowii]|uniref:probable basic-leucine zipper transcription factor R n=1 Tax=Uranotaenia lowii TaxID=190385 RepID=UPI00247956A7|nr:probable basic-leucine zipper transcription factor R [Uranotaenia lowii]